MSKKDLHQSTASQAGSGAGTGISVAAVPFLQQQVQAYAKAGKWEAALKACRQILSVQPKRPDVLSFAGMMCVELGQLDEAVDLYSRAVVLKPDFIGAIYNLANTQQRLGQLEAAREGYARALSLKPDMVAGHHNLGGVLQSLGRFEEAVRSYERALSLRPTAETQRDLGVALQKLGRLDAAVAAFRRALALRPNWPPVLDLLVHAFFEKRDHAAAAELCAAWLKTDPLSVDGMALRALALNELGEREAARTILDLDRFVQIFDFDAAPGYESVAALNADLVQHVEAHPTLAVPPKDDPTYHNDALEITGELLAEPKGPMAALEAMIRDAIGRYLTTVRRDPPHPFTENFPQRWRLTSWATRLAGQGNLVPHIHLDGYLGGVYYPLLPDVVRAEGQGEAGWFELGRPPESLHCQAEPITRHIQPKEGRMLLFPGYFFHNTVPFRSSERRISIAFDLVPLA